MMKKEPNKGNRKSLALYKKDYPRMAYRYALLGATLEEMANALGVTMDVFVNWTIRHPELNEAIRRGRIEADANVAHSLYKRACGYTADDLVILSNRITEYDDDGKPIRSYNEPLKVKIKKHYPPNTHAALKWLQIRQREKWADRQTIDHRHIMQNEMTVRHVFEKEISDPEKLTIEELKLALKLGVKRAAKEIEETNN